MRSRNNLRLIFSAGSLLLLFGMFPLSAQPMEERPNSPDQLGPISLSIETVLQRVEEDNLEILLNREGIEEALQTVRQRRASLYPSLNLNLTQSRSQFVNVGRGFDFPGADPVAPPASRFDARIQANVPVIDTDLITSYRSAKLGYAITQLDYETLLQNVLEATATAYFDHLRNLSGMEVIQANIERNRSLLNLARDRLKSGVATQIDVTRAEVTLAQSEQSLLQQETLLLESELRLKRLLDIDLDREIILDPLQERLEARPQQLSRLALGTILEKRTDYQSARIRQERQLLARKAAIWQRFPQIELFGNYGVASDEAFSGSYENAWAAGIRFSVPVFEGFRIQSERLEAESGIRSQEYVIRRLEQEVGSTYRLFRKQVQSRYDQIQVAKKSRDLSRKELDLASTRFEQGVADNTEVVDAQQNLAAAEDNYIEALYQYGLARLALARTLGNVRTIAD